MLANIAKQLLGQHCFRLRQRLQLIGIAMPHITHPGNDRRSIRGMSWDYGAGLSRTAEPKGQHHIQFLHMVDRILVGKDTKGIQYASQKYATPGIIGGHNYGG